MLAGVNKQMYIKFFFLLYVFLTLSLNAKSYYVVDQEYSAVVASIEKYINDKKLVYTKKEDKIFQIYFDVPELKYLKENGYIRYEALEYLSKKKRKKKYKEHIFYSNNGDEVKTYKVKHYKNPKSFEDKNPFLGLIKRKEREDFFKNLANNNIKYPMRLKKILEVSKLTTVFTFNNNNDNISISNNIASSMNSEDDFVLLTFDIINPIFEKSLLELIKIKNDYKSTNEYVLVFNRMKNNILLFPLILRYPYIINFMYGVLFAILGLSVLFILFRKQLNEK